MHTLIFQIVFKQWDKSQRSPDCQAVISQTPNVYPVASQPQFMLFELPCVLEQHALDFIDNLSDDTQTERVSGKQAGRVIKQAILSDGSAKLDRFIISKQDKHFQLSYEDEEGMVSDIGLLDNGWIQAQYQWRYRIEKNNEIFWQYEEVTLNAALIDEINFDVFLAQPPASTLKKEP
ncbi:MAG: hypothetical protein HWE39_02875 [Oceanospirillaceae bacterium]|nr:hypothetical protein [Oceanospirillaceae bacterium]